MMDKRLTLDRLARVIKDIDAGLTTYLTAAGSHKQALTIRLMLLKEERAELEAQLHG